MASRVLALTKVEPDSVDAGDINNDEIIVPGHHGAGTTFPAWMTQLYPQSGVLECGLREKRTVPLLTSPDETNCT